MENIITVKNLSKSYGKLKVINDLSFSVKKGTVMGLLGANGAGKSTTIECVLGTKSIDSGFISILDLDPKINRKELFEKVGIQFQETSYQDNIKVKEICEVTAALYNHSTNYNDLLKKFELFDRKNSFVKELSGGQKQKLSIILALIPNPEVIFVDELTTGLDVKSRRNIWQKLSNMKSEGLSILLTSHFMDEVESLCDTICILKDGKSIFYGTVKEAIDKSPYDKFEDAYLWYTNEEETINENL